MDRGVRNKGQGYTPWGHKESDMTSDLACTHLPHLMGRVITGEDSGVGPSDLGPKFECLV